MRNLKHTIIAIAAIVMVGTLSFFQVSDISAKKSERDAMISSASQVHSMTIASTEDESGSVAVALSSTEEELESAEASDDSIDAATEQAIAEKSYLTLGYANVTGSVELRSNPSDEAEAIGTINGADQVEVLESTDGWYKIMDNGQAGYVESAYVTLNKAEAQDSAMQYDHYKKANVSAQSGLTVRAAGSENSASVGLVNDGDDIIIVGKEGNYTKIIYGRDYTEGYVINSGIEMTGEWIEKQTVSAEKQRVAMAKLEAERQEKIARANAAKASPRYSTTDTSSAAASRTGGGQGIVNTAMKYLGTPYVWGGTSPSGFDCSGLVQYACRANGISVPRVAASQRNAGRYVSRENLQPGDLVFFSNGGGVSHVGIYIGNGNMVHAPQTGDVVKVSSINTSYRLSHYAGAVRVW